MIWLIGAGDMSVEYAKVLQSQDEEFLVIGRGHKSAETFEEKTLHKVNTGGVDTFLSTSPIVPKAAIVSVGVEQLYDTTIQLLNYGVKRILVEKPGGLTFSEIERLRYSSVENNAELYIAYNRRFYSSVIKLRELIELDGGVTSFNFEFTEWSHVIEKLENKKSNVLTKWFLANSTHVVDLAFYLAGKPDRISCYTSGELNWHLSSSIFSGAGITEKGALFHYGANWESAGRWSIEILTDKNRYILRPMEKLQVQNRGSIEIKDILIDDSIDKEFKPGLYRQVESFLISETDTLCSIKEQFLIYPVYENISGY